MIKLENTDVFGWEAAIRGMRNPMNSWDKSDSDWVVTNQRQVDLDMSYPEYEYNIGDADLKLMQNLAKAGTDHSKYLRMINVTVDITGPLYWWKEFDTYKVGTVTNSCSTMHKIHSKEFTMDDFSHDQLVTLGALNDSLGMLRYNIAHLNFWRERFNESDEARKNYFEFNGYNYVPTKKECWWQMIQLLPSSYNQKRTVQMNYQVLWNMHEARKNHKLDEWHTFCDWIKTLPYFCEIFGIGGNNEQTIEA